MTSQPKPRAILTRDHCTAISAGHLAAWADPIKKAERLRKTAETRARKASEKASEKSK